MNSKQRRKIIRKHIKSITLLRVKQRLAGGDGLLHFSDYELARDFENSPIGLSMYELMI